MVRLRFIMILLALTAVLLLLEGCPSTQRTPSASFPLAGGKIWRDTTATVSVPSVGRFQVVVSNGQINITPPPGLNTLRWSIVSKKSDAKTEKQKMDNRSMAASGTGDEDGDGVPDCEDWCVNAPGPRENNGCPAGIDGVPPIRWIELMSMSDKGDVLVIEYGAEGCVQ